MHPADCAPTAPVAVLEIHGTADRTVAYGGGTLDVGFGAAEGRVSRRRCVDRRLGEVRRLFELLGRR